MRQLERLLTDCAIRHTSISIRGNHDPRQRRTKLIIFTDVREGYETSGNYSKCFKICMLTAFLVHVSASWMRSFYFTVLIHIRWVQRISVYKIRLVGRIDTLSTKEVNADPLKFWIPEERRCVFNFNLESGKQDVGRRNSYL